MPNSSRILPLGRTCCTLLTLTIAARVATSFLPCPAWGPSAYLCAAGYLNLPLGEPHTCVADAAIPEGARVSNRMKYLHFRKEQFTLDGRGHRNGPAAYPRQPQVLLVGSSFSLGMALSDDETFSARLNQEMGPVVYNAASVFDNVLSADSLVQTAQENGMERGVILVEILNRASFRYSPPQKAASGGRSVGTESGYKGIPKPLVLASAPLIREVRQIKHAYPLMRVSALLNMRLHNDSLLPNPFREEFPEVELQNGRRVLVYSGDRNFSQRPEDPSITTKTLLRIDADLKQRGYRLAVLLLPNAYSVYYPLLRDQSTPDGSEAYFHSVYTRLAANHVAVLNLLPNLRGAARRELAEDRTIYYPDDAHWNAMGCSIAAHKAAEWLRSLLRGEVAQEE